MNLNENLNEKLNGNLNERENKRKQNGNSKWKMDKPIYFFARRCKNARRGGRLQFGSDIDLLAGGLPFGRVFLLAWLCERGGEADVFARVLLLVIRVLVWLVPTVINKLSMKFIYFDANPFNFIYLTMRSYLWSHYSELHFHFGMNSIVC